jgi:gas vesicle protein
MGFFDDIGAVLGEINSFKEELTDTLKQTVEDVTSSADKVKEVGQEAAETVQQSSQDLKDKVRDVTKL